MTWKLRAASIAISLSVVVSNTAMADCSPTLLTGCTTTTKTSGSPAVYIGAAVAVGAIAYFVFRAPSEPKKLSIGNDDTWAYQYSAGNGFSLIKRFPSFNSAALTMSSLGLEPTIRYVDAGGLVTPLGGQFSSSTYSAAKVDYKVNFVKMKLRF